MANTQSCKVGRLIRPVIVLYIVAAALAGCGGESTTTGTQTAPSEEQKQATNAMENFMKNQTKSKTKSAR